MGVPDGCEASRPEYTGLFSDAGSRRLTSPQDENLFHLRIENVPPLCRFVFANWDEDGNAYLEMVAKIELRRNYNSRMAPASSVMASNSFSIARTSVSLFAIRHASTTSRLRAES